MRFTKSLAGLITCSLVCVATGRAEQLLHALPGPAAGDGWAPALSSADFDGDGNADLALGVPHANGLTGMVLVYSHGDPSALIYQLFGVNAGDRFGAALSPTVDLDGDDLPDLMVGAPGSDAVATGLVRVFSGATGMLLFEVAGTSAGSRFGTALGNPKDIDADGVSDLLIGAPSDSTAGADAGLVAAVSGLDGTPIWTLHGGTGDSLGASISRPTWSSDIDDEPIIGASQGGAGAGYVIQLSGPSLETALRLDGSNPGDSLGTRVANASDLNGDGVPDFLAATRVGSVMVFSGADHAVLQAFTGLPTSLGAEPVPVDLGDVDGDGTPDIGIGLPSSDSYFADGGEVRIYSGVDYGLRLSLAGTESGSQLGAALVSMGDLDGDTLQDLATSAPGSDAGGIDSGSVSVVSFTRWVDQDTGVAGTHGVPSLSGRGGLLPGTDVELAMEGALENAAAILIIGHGVGLDTLHGLFVPTPDSTIPGLLTDANGELEMAFTWTVGMPSVLYFQYVVTDPQGPYGLALSNTIKAIAP